MACSDLQDNHSLRELNSLSDNIWVSEVYRQEGVSEQSPGHHKAIMLKARKWQVQGRQEVAEERPAHKAAFMEGTI